MAAISLHVNGASFASDAAPTTPLLYVLRNDLGLPGTRFGCGLGLCGACTVIIDGRAVLSCDTPLWAVENQPITTIEASPQHAAIAALQAAFLAEQAAQCGYCTTGLIMAAAALLVHTPNPDEQQIRDALSRNLCRCGVHVRVLRAVQRAADALAS